MHKAPKMHLTYNNNISRETRDKLFKGSHLQHKHAGTKKGLYYIWAKVELTSIGQGWTDNI